MIYSKDPLAQLETSKSSTDDLFKDLSDEIKGFKYQTMVKVFLRKHKEKGRLEFAPVCFNSNTKFEYDLDKFFQEILCTIDNWVNEGSGWVFKSVDAEYMNMYPKRITKADKNMVNDLD